MRSRTLIALTVIGGLDTLTMRSFVIIPVVYTLVDDPENYMGEKERGDA